uniref:uncharacterized protein LOC132678093 isoform X1 n=1 Tax=Panthera onca TaxID=9690 RepID=UPI0029542044|nr:uncharacterized protein LOC132678093 isoform X1 [Panthera onca]XP_060486021.1 uncharacterized protein LOC132678093 isoform X1 [Panthera onca]XP_060486022.1 uncharacterized protein LOC132678093 isoform X1 [Panthera onca]XP_060486023.1 uncharacterized protein LOC132678093 isoform X1 [Panthera onca]
MRDGPAAPHPELRGPRRADPATPWGPRPRPPGQRPPPGAAHLAGREADPAGRADKGPPAACGRRGPAPRRVPLTQPLIKGPEPEGLEALETDGCGLGDRRKGSGRCRSHTQTQTHTLASDAHTRGWPHLRSRGPATGHADPQRTPVPTHSGALRTRIRRRTHKTRSHTLPGPMGTLTHTLIHTRKTARRRTHTRAYAHLHVHTRSRTHARQGTNSQSPTERHSPQVHSHPGTYTLVTLRHTRRRHGDTRTLTGRLHPQQTRNYVHTTAYTRTYAHAQHPLRWVTRRLKHTQTLRGIFMQTRACTLTAFTHTWMPTHTHTHTPSKQTHTGARTTSGSHTLWDAARRHKPRGWTVQPARARSRPRPTRTRKNL